MEKIISTITTQGYEKAASNTPNKNGFRIELTQAEVWANGIRKTIVPVSGVASGAGNQIRVRCTITSERDEYSYNELRLIDGISGVVFAIMKRADNGTIDFVSPYKKSVFSYAMTFTSLPDAQVTILADNGQAAVLAELDAHKTDENAHQALFNLKVNKTDLATASEAGVMKVLNVLNSTDTLSALSAAQGKALNDAITTLNNRSDFCPSGKIGLFAMDYAPAGWLKANGAAVSRTLYANLFAAIGTRFGAGDGYSTFNLPDLRGEFPRFWDDGRGVDAGRTFGTAQYDAVQNWEAVFTYQRAQVHGVEKREGAFMLESEHDFGDAIRGNHWATSHAHIGPAVNNAARTASETRPRNIALLACIKI